MRLPAPRRFLPLALALGLGVAGCAAAASGAAAPGRSARTSATPPPAPSTTATPLGPQPVYEVATRTLALTDPSRPTDPGSDRPATRGRDLPTTLWYPATGAGPFPVVVFSHGFTGLPSDYEPLLTAWASAGFVVAAPAFPLTRYGSAQVIQDVLNQPADVSFVLTQVLALNHTAGDPLDGRIDEKHVAAAGHSAGAVTTIGLLDSCCADRRITAAVIMAGTPQGFGLQFAHPGVPTLVLHGTADQSVPYADGQRVYAALPGPKAFVSLPGAGHTGPWDHADDLRFPATRAMTTDFLRWALTGRPDGLTAFRQEAQQPGIAELTDDRLGGVR